MDLNKLIEQYKDENGFISNLTSLFYELDKNHISLKEIYDIISNIQKINEKIIEQIKKDNKRMISIINKKEQEKETIHEEITKDNNIEIKVSKNKSIKIDIDFYIKYINENLEDNKYLEILPNNNDQESLKIIDSILIYYFKEINYIKYFLNIEKNNNEINNMQLNLITYNDIFQTIKNYKENVLYIPEEKHTKNELVYFMKGNLPYIISDLKGEETSYQSIYSFLESIENGKFKNPKMFTSNEKFKGIMEVRDLENQTRIFFTSLGNRKYCVFYCLVDKKETNKLYKEALYNRFKIFKENYNLYETVDIKKILEK